MIPITYDEPLFRPPGEAGSLLIQLTLGCSHNRCTFCAMYRKKSFGLRSFSEIARDLDSAADYFNHRSEAVRKIFLCDGDALAAPSELLLAVLERANALFPSLRRIGIYAAAQNVLGKSSEELRLFQARKLCLAYIGLESGSDAVLKYVGKGNTAAEASAAVKRLSENNWQTSLIVMLGLGGREHNREHRELTARFISQTPPRFLSFLTTVAVPGTRYHTCVQQGAITPLSSRELLEEMHYLIAHFSSEQRIILRANHVSNQFPLEGVLPKDRAKLLSQLEAWIAECPPDLYPRANPFVL